MAVSTKPPISSNFWFSSSNSTVKCRTVYPSRLAESSRDVIFGFLAGGGLEDYVRAVVLDQAAKQEKTGVVLPLSGAGYAPPTPLPSTGPANRSKNMARLNGPHAKSPTGKAYGSLRNARK